MTLQNEYAELAKACKPHYLRRVARHPFFGYIVLMVMLVVVQLLYMFTGLISLTVSQAINTTMILAVAALGVGILLMMAGLMSFGTGAFMGLGTFIAGNLLKVFDLPFVFYLAAVALAGVVIGVVVGVVSLRAKGIHLLIITMALSGIMGTMFVLPNTFTGGPSGLSGVPFPTLIFLFDTSRETMYFVVLVVTFLLIAVTLNIINSSIGRAMLGMSQSESLAQAMGIYLLKYRVLAFVVATVYSMLAGALYVASISSSSPYTWTTALSMNILVAVIIGGTAKPAGVIAGSFIMFCLDLAILKSIPFFVENPTFSVFFMGILIILIVMKYPGGLMWMLASLKYRLQTFRTMRRLKKYGPDES
ncbi:MAG: branched-chain amino acid ABC transporter permease [Oscillospiraceae bacterium]|jgi:branched-chain amino acid transport system permease protein|nr:branched-chain amino acid ABC transporter permease [Oscillospiraceae bacterium]